jgi:hypothetical protein
MVIRRLEIFPSSQRQYMKEAESNISPTFLQTIQKQNSMSNGNSLSGTGFIRHHKELVKSALKRSQLHLK